MFSGGCQDARFSKLLKELLLSEHGAEALEALGLNINDVGSHSCRKGIIFKDDRHLFIQLFFLGAGSYATSGSVDAPSVVAVFLRAGWTLGNVKDRYLFLSGAGDEHVGRTVAGLPSDSSDFALLPPHFADPSDDVILKAIRSVFPTLYNHDGVRFVLPFLLASLVYHFDFLDRTLALDHRLRLTPLFTSISLVDTLKPLVLCGLESPVLTPTGIPV